MPEANNVNKCLVKLLRRPIYLCSGSFLCEFFCSLTKHIFVCYWTCGCMFTCRVSSRVAGFELVLPVVCRSGEIYSFPYVETGVSPLWLMEECQNSSTGLPSSSPKTSSLTSLTEMQPLLGPRKLEKENTRHFIWFSPGSRVGVHFPFVVVVTSFLSGAVSDLCS